jgi:hypothetical protein
MKTKAFTVEQSNYLHSVFTSIANFKKAETKDYEALTNHIEQASVKNNLGSNIFAWIEQTEYSDIQYDVIILTGNGVYQFDIDSSEIMYPRFKKIMHNNKHLYPAYVPAIEVPEAAKFQLHIDKDIKKHLIDLSRIQGKSNIYDYNVYIEKNIMSSTDSYCTKVVEYDKPEFNVNYPGALILDNEIIKVLEVDNLIYTDDEYIYIVNLNNIVLHRFLLIKGKMLPYDMITKQDRAHTVTVDKKQLKNFVNTCTDIVTIEGECNRVKINSTCAETGQETFNEIQTNVKHNFVLTFQKKHLLTCINRTQDKHINICVNHTANNAHQIGDVYVMPYENHNTVSIKTINLVKNEYL